MPTTAAEIKDLVQTVENAFKSGGKDPHARSQEVRDIIFGRYDYTKELSPYLTQKLGVAADILRVYKDQMIAALRTDMRLHLEPVGSGKRKDTAADNVELMEAHQLMRLNRDGLIVEDVNYYLATGLYWAGWLEMQSFEEPEQAKDESDADFTARSKRERDGWFPWTLRTLNPKSVSWAEEERLPTVAVLHYRKPVIDLLCRYGKSYNVRREDPKHALRILNQHFGFLRGDEDRSTYDEHAMFGEEIEVVVCDDGARISHYADLAVKTADARKPRGDSASNRYEGLGDQDYDNPFGQCSLLLAEGVYNPYESPGYRREGLLMAAINIEHAKSRVKSHWASEAAAPPIIFRKQPSEQNASTDNEPLVIAPIMDAEGRPIAPNMYGELMQLHRDVDATVEKLYSVFNDETAMAAMRSYLFDPDKSNSKDVTASVRLAQIDEANKMLAGAQSSKCRMFSRALDMIRYSQVHKQNSHRTKGEPSRETDQGYVAITTGKETKIKGRAIKNGEPINVTPQDLDQEYVRTLEPFDNSVATMEARGQRASRRWAEGTILWDERLEEEGVENVSEYNEKLTEQQLYQIEAPQMVSDMRMRVAQFSAVVTGLPVEQVLLGLPEDVIQPIVNANAPGGPAVGGGMNVQRFGSPVQNQPAAQGSTSVV